MFGPAAPVLLLVTITTWLVVTDNLDGRYDKGQAGLILDNPAKPVLTFRQKLSLIAKNQFEVFNYTEPTVVLFSMIPELQATWSLIWRGTTFEYAVAPKPQAQTDMAKDKKL